MASRAPRPVRNRRAPPRMAVRGGLPGWAWLLLGLALGAAGAALFYISQSRPSALVPLSGQVPQSPPTTAPAASDKAIPAPQPPSVPVPLENRYEFYELLKKGELILPESDTAKAPATPSAPAAIPDTPPAEALSGRFILQVGSYRNFEDADRVKASLALLGMDAHIEKAALRAGETWYRVRVGPLTDARQMETLRAQMKANGINALLIRVGG